LDYERGGRNRLLKRGVIVDAFARVAGKIGVVDVADYTDDGGPRRAPAPHVPVERVLARPVLARQIFIDDHHRRGTPQSLTEEVAAALEWNPHGFEIAWGYVPHVPMRTGIARRE